MKEYVVKPSGNSLHILVSKKDFKEGEIVRILKDSKWEIRVREIAKEEIEGLQQRY